MAAQYRFDGTVQNSIGEAVAGCQVYVCTQPASTGSIPPSPLATLFADPNGVTPLANPVIVDGNGNFFFYTVTGVYTLVFFDPFGRIPTLIFPDQAVVTQGGGSVTSVALTMPAEYSVAGSPISSSGTFVVTKANQNANLIMAGPASGPAAAPGYRAMVTADLPSGVGTVTSVGASVTPGTLFTATFTGGPVTGSGTLNLTFDFATQSANTFLAGPSSGSSGPISARKMVPADQPGLITKTFNATETFDASTGNSFALTLTGNVTSSSITNPTAGQTITFIITQDATGGRTIAWPANLHGFSSLAPEANSVSVQSFIYDGTNWRATGPGSTNPS